MNSLYQDIILDHYRNPRNRRIVPHATHSSSAANRSCGDSLSMTLFVQDGIIKEVGFQGSGCAISQASASLLTEAVQGENVAKADALDREAILKLLGTPISPSRLKCALLSLEALKRALRSSSQDNK